MIKKKKILHLILALISFQIQSILCALSPQNTNLFQSSDYRFEYFNLQGTITANTVIVLDFSSSLLTTPVGALSNCYQIQTNFITLATTNIQFNSCTCTAQKVCSLVIPQDITDMQVVVQFGPITNPSWIEPSQNIGLTMGQVTQTINIAGSAYTPGALTKVSMTQGSNQVGQFNDYVIQFRLGHSTQAGGAIRVIMPIGINDQDMKFSSQIQMDLQVHGGTEAINVNLGTLQTSITNSYYDILGTNALLANSIAVNQNSYIQLRIRQVRNPVVLTTSATSITIQTLTTSNKVIDQISTGLQGVSSVAAAITFGSISSSSTVVGTTTTMTFKLQPQSVFLSGGKMTVTFPSEFSFGGVTCTYSFGLTANGASSCTQAAQIVSTVNMYYPNKDIQISVDIAGIINPYSVKPTASFTFQTYDSSNNIIAQYTGGSQSIYTATVGALTLASGYPKRSDNNANVVTDILVKFTTATKIVSGTVVHTKIQKTQVVAISNTFTCQKIVSQSTSSLACSLKAEDSTSYTIEFSEYCSVSNNPCLTGTVMEYSITGFKNTLWVDNTLAADNVVVSTMTAADQSGNNYAIDTHSSALPVLLTPVTYTTQTFTRSVSSVAGLDTKWLMGLTGVMYTTVVSGNSNILVNFPRDQVCSPVSGNIVCKVITASGFTFTLSSCTVAYWSQTAQQMIDEPCKSIQTVYFNSVCGTASNCNTLTADFQLEITSIANYMVSPSTPVLSSTNYFGVRIQDIANTKTLQFMTTSNPTMVDLLPNPFHALTLTFTNSVTGQLAEYTFTINPNQILPTTSYYMITLSTENSMSQNVGCTATINSLTAVCTPDIPNKRVKIDFSSLFTANSITPSTFQSTTTSIIVLINNINNPSSTKPSSDILVQSLTSSAQLMSQSTKSITMSLPNTFQSFTITRSATMVNTPLTLTLTFRPTNAIAASTSYIEFKIARQQVIIANNNNMLIAQTKPVAQSNVGYTVVLSNNDYLTIKIILNNCPCSTTQDIEFVISNGLTNPPTTKLPTISNTLSTKTTGAYLQDQQQVDMTPPVSGGILQITLTNNQPDQANVLTFTPIEYTFDITFYNDLPSGGYMDILFPDNMLYHSGNNQVVVTTTVGGTTTTQSTVTTTLYSTNTNFNFLKQILIQGTVCTSGCVKNGKMTLKISNLIQSPYSTVDLTNLGNVKITTYAPDTSVVDSGDIPCNNFRPTQLTELPTATITRDNQTPGSTTVSLTITVNIGVTPIEQNSIIRITFPPDQAQAIYQLITSQPTVRRYINNALESTNSIINLVQSDVNTFVIDINEFCSNNNRYCPANSVMKFQVSNVQNGYYVTSVTTSDVLINIYKTDINTQQFKAVSAASNLRVSPELLVSAFTSLTPSMSNYNVGEQSYLQVEVTLLSPVPQNGVFRLLVNQVDLLITQSSNQCSIGAGSLSSSFVNYVSGTCTFTTHSTNAPLYYREILFQGSPCASAVCQVASQYVIRLQGTNRLYSKTNTQGVSLYSQTSNALPISQMTSSGVIAPFTAYTLQQLSFTRSSSTLNSQIDFTLTMTPTIPLMAGSTLMVTIPQNEQELQSTTSAVSCAIVNPSPMSLPCTITVDAQNIYITFTQEFCKNNNNVVDCTANTQIDIKVTGLKNPQFVINTVNNINYKPLEIISYYQNTNQMIFKSKLNLLVSPELTIPKLQESVIQRTDGTIQLSSAKIYIQFKIPSSMSSTDQIQIVFPKDTVYSQNYNNKQDITVSKIQDMSSYTVVSGLTATQTFSQDLRSKYYLSNLQITNYCSSTCAAGSFIYIGLSGFKNPEYLTSESNILDYQLQVINNQNQIVSRININAKYVVWQLKPLALGTPTVTRSVNSVNTLATVAVSFSSQGYSILQNSFINLMVPVTQFTYPGKMGITCRKTADNSVLSSCIIVEQNNYLNITLKEFCSSGGDCPLVTTLAFTIEGLKNPSYNPSQSDNNAIYASLKVGHLYTYAKSIAIYPTPNVQAPVFLTNLAITRDNNVAGNTALITTKFTIPSDLPSTTKLYLQLPPFAFYSLSNQECQNVAGTVLQCDFIQNNDPLDSRLIHKYITQVNVNNLCGIQVYCSANAVVTLKFKLRNQINTADFFSSAQFNFLIVDNNVVQQSQGFLSNTLGATTAGVFTNSQFTASTFKVKALNIDMCLLTETKNTFSSNDFQGKLVVVLPTQILTKNTFTCDVNLMNTDGTVNSNVVFFCTYDNQQTLTIKYYQTIIDMSFSQLRICLNNGLNNHVSNLPSGSFQLSTSEYIELKQAIVPIDSTTTGIEYIAKVLGNVVVSSFTRSNLFLQTDTTISFAFTMEYSVPANSVVELKITQSKQMEFKTGETLSCQDVSTGSTLTCTASTTSILFPTLCQAGCADGAGFSIKVLTGVKNVDYVLTEAQLKANNYYFILYVNMPDGSQTNGNELILATPFLKTGVITMQGFTRSDDVIFNKNSLIIKLTSQSKIYNNNILTWTLPTNFLQDDQVYPQQINCFKLNYNDLQFIQQLPCKVVTYSNNVYSEINQVQIQQVCGLTSCGPSYQLAVKVQQVRNVGYYKAVSSASEFKVHFQAPFILSTYGDVDTVTFPQTQYFQTLSKSSLKIISLLFADPTPNVRTTFRMTLEAKVAIYTNSVFKIQFANGFSIDAAQYQCQLLGPVNQIGSCVNANALVTMSNIVNVYINNGIVVLSIDNFLTPGSAGDYSGTTISIYSAENNLIMSSTDDVSNDQVVVSVYTKSTTMSCNGQCKTCGKTKNECLTCYNPGASPFLSTSTKSCVSQCGANQYLLEVQPSAQGLLPQYSCEQCASSCLSCYGGSSQKCTACDTQSINNVFSEGACIPATSCPMVAAVVSGKCQMINSNECASSCATCGPGKTFCYSCKTGYILETITGKCILKDTQTPSNTQCSLPNYYVDLTTNTCKACNLECKTCSSSSTCTTCNTFYGLFYQYQGKCESTCPVTTYPSTNQICQSCPSKCSSCTSATTCYSCTSPAKLQVSTSTCVDSCPNGFQYTISNNLCSDQQCTNAKCYQCTGVDKNVCTSCSRNNGYEVLQSNTCVTPTEACASKQTSSAKFIYNTQLQTCQQCHLTFCKQCGLTPGQTYQVCNECDTGKYLYNNRCVTRCPTGTQFSINLDNNPSYIQKCIQVSCLDTNCKYCNPVTRQCYFCKDGYALAGNSCGTSCPKHFYVQSTSDRGTICIDPYSGQPGGWAPFIWVLIFFACIYIGLSYRKHRNKYLVPSAFISLFSLIDFLTRFGLLVLLYHFTLTTPYINAITLVAIFANSLFAYFFKILYLSLYQENFKSFKIFTYFNTKFYNVVIVFTLLAGVMFTEVFLARLLKFPSNTFHKLLPYKNSLIRMQMVSLILSILQTIAYFYIMIQYSYIKNQAWFLSLTGFLVNLIIFVNFGLRRMIEKKHYDMLNTNEDNIDLIQQYDDEQQRLKEQELQKELEKEQEQDIKNLEDINLESNQQLQEEDIQLIDQNNLSNQQEQNDKDKSKSRIQ